MYPFPLIRSLARAALVAAIACCGTFATAANYYVNVAGAGAQNGSSWANAAPQGSLQTLLNGLAAGDILYVGSGTYSLASITVSGDGTASARKQLVGADTGAGYPVFQGTYAVPSTSGGTFLSLPTTANYWTVKNLVIRNHRFPVSLTQSGTTYTRYTNLLFENIVTDSLEDALRLYNCSDITVRNFTAIRYTKKGFRVSDYSQNVLFDRCYADCTGGDPDFPAQAIPNGFFCDDTAGLAIIHDITFQDCTTLNNGYYSVSSSSYWNGDGFSSERGAYNITLIRCASYDNWDAGFDNKASNMTFQDCVAAGNLRGFRHWGTTASFTNCLSVNLVKRGGTGGTNAFWFDDTAVAVTLDRCTAAALSSASTLAYVETDTTNGPLNFTNSLFYHGGTGAFTNSGNITLAASTVSYRVGTGTDPQLVAPNANWRGAPANAWNNQLYGTSKGYSSTTVSSPANAAPVLDIAAAPTSGIAPLGVQFTTPTASDSDGVIASYAWDFGDGTTSFAKNPSHTYGLAGTFTVTCTVTDNRGAKATDTLTITATMPTTPVEIRIEAGGTNPFTDSAGKSWAADYGYDTGGGITDRGAIAIANTVDDRLYQTERYQTTGYSLLVANGRYNVRLHFAETYSGTTAAGQRVFTATAQGAIPSGWGDIDLFAQAGANTAVIKSAIVQVTDNILDLGFINTVGGTLINGIEILPVSTGSLPPTAPGGLAASAITNTSFTVTWGAGTDDTGIAGYEVFLNGAAIATTTGTTNRTATIVGLAAGTTYAVTVRTRDLDGNLSGPSAALNVTTSGSLDTTAPSIPTGLAASAITSTAFTVSWTAATDNVAVTGYEVFVNGASYATPGGTSASITGRSPGTTYAVTVRARDAAGNYSAQSSALNVTTAAVTTTYTLGSVQDVLVKAGASATTNFASYDYLTVKNEGSGNDLTRQSYLRFDLSSVPSGTTIVSATLKLTVADAKENQTHTLKFVANDTWLESTLTWNTKPAGSTVLATVPGTAAANTVVSYDVTAQVATERAGDGLISLMLEADNNEYATYHSKEAANTAYRPVLEIVTSGVAAPTAPTNLAASSITQTGFTVSWTASTSSLGIASYEVFVNGVSAGTSTTTSKGITGRTAGTTYSVTVVAKDTAGTNSAASSALSVTTTAAATTYSLGSAQDVLVKAGASATTNFASYDYLTVKNEGIGNDLTRQSYLRFDLSSVPSGGTIVSATLKLTVADAKENQTHTLKFVANDTWLESTLTWNTKPAGSTVLATVPGTAAANTVVSYDVTAQVATERAGDGLISLMLEADNNEYSTYYSKEAANTAYRPVLEIVRSP